MSQTPTVACQQVMRLVQQLQMAHDATQAQARGVQVLPSVTVANGRSFGGVRYAWDQGT